LKKKRRMLLSRYIFDVETDGLLPTITTVHCLTIMDIDTQEMQSFTPDTIKDGIKLLEEASVIIGHNVINFDIPAIKKVYPWFNPKGKVRDTLVCSRLIWANMLYLDSIRRKLPGKMMGLHSLKSWGMRLGCLKGEFTAESADVWEHYTPEMLEYNKQDVQVTYKLFKLIEKQKYSAKAIVLEHEFATVIDLMVKHGFRFNYDNAVSLQLEVLASLEALEEELSKAFPPFVDEEIFIPKVNNLARGYVKGEPFTKVITTKFNPGSRDHIIRALRDYFNFELIPVLKRVKGKREKQLVVEVGEEALLALPFKEGKLLGEYKTIQKLYGTLANGDKSWLKCVTSNNRIHGSVNTNGAVTGRCSHSKPNIAQVPKAQSDKRTGSLIFGRESGWGSDCRALFMADAGWVLVGADASGLELRCLAHYMAEFDGGAYVDVVLNGDIHTVNQQAAGLPTRDAAKTFIYAHNYGAGDEELGSIVGGGKAEGAKLRRTFKKKLPALGKLVASLEAKVESSGSVVGLDGRIIPSRSSHSTLNFLLQSAGSILVKKATTLFYEGCKSKGWVFGTDYALVAHVHDEMQVTCEPAIADELGFLLVESIRQAGIFFRFRCPLDGEYKVGNNWAETH
jgi:DNA polymerase I-like protein with 3'-5' exonuclease and polymerase domains